MSLLLEGIKAPPHSTRKVALSLDLVKSTNIQDIMNHRGWSSSPTFFKHYNLKPVQLAIMVNLT